MKTILLSASFCFFSLILTSQVYFDFFTNELGYCYNDLSTEVILPELIEMYQTKDNTITGEIDSNICIPLIQTTDGLKIDVTQVDIKRAMFIRHKVYKDFESYTPLQYNAVYSIAGFVSGPVTNYIIDDVCENNVCSKFYLSYTVPSEDNNSFVHRTVDYPLTFACDFSSCLPTQKFETGQYISDVTMQLYLTDEAKNQGNIKLPGFDMYQGYEVNLIEEDVVVPEQYYDGIDKYSANIEDLIENNWANNFLLKHNLASYPSEANRAYIEFVPEENKTEAQLIEIVSWAETGLHFQDYTSVRAGLVEGSDSIRHQLDVQFSSSQCIFWVELVVGGGTSLTFKQGGNVDLFGSEACLQLRDESTMRIVDNQQFYYGGDGKGNLAMAEKGNIYIEPGSNFIFGGNIILLNNDGNPLNDQAYINLPTGASLTLLKDMKINGHFAEHMKLDIYMNGGYLDMQNIAVETREKINLIFPSQKQGQFLTYPNPAVDYIVLDLFQEEPISYEIYTFDGKFVKGGLIGGIQERLAIEELSGGLYFIRSKVENQILTSRFVVIERQ